MFAAIKRRFPRLTCVSIFAFRPKATSDHHTGLGLDVGGPLADRRALVGILLGLPFLKYVIHEDTIWIASRGWAPGAQRDGGKHHDHVHISFKPEFKDHIVKGRK
jgi:hypothetical protein